jgi:N-acetylglucosaminyldiphosphoundecaprenol N-acetyl-beta-D-mannosaminyltransferase
MFGVKITPMDAQEQLELVERQVEAHKHCVITYLNLHGLHVLKDEPAMVELHRAGITHVVIDGMPLIALCRLAGIDVTRNHRVTNLDLIWPLLSNASEKGWSVYYVGSSQDVVDRSLRAIRNRLPALKIRAHHGFIGLDCPEVINDIIEFGANIVFVGMGTGLQERWIRKNIEDLPPMTVISVGALFEYIAGTVRTPPRWMGRAGLEWLFRLLDDPKRFWRRYLLEPWGVAWALAGKLARSDADGVAS